MKKSISIISVLLVIFFVGFSQDSFGQRKKLQIRNGTHLFRECQGSASCGPCPGICIRRVPKLVDADYVLSEDERAEGDIIVEVELNESGDKLVLYFLEDVSDFSGVWGVDEDFLFPDDISEVLGKSSIELSAGTSIIDYERGEFGVVEMAIK